MRCSSGNLALVTTLLLLVPGCGSDPGELRRPAATSTARPDVEALTAADVDMFVAVRAKAMTRLETELDEAESAGSALARIAELSVAEQDAVGALGFEWRRYRWAREEIARLHSAQRQREDSLMLTIELTRARDDLAAQLQVARDPASRQFLEAQVASLNTQLEKLAGGTQVGEGEARGLELIARVRAYLAVQQGRQERIQKRLRELIQRERAGGTAAATPSPPASR